MGLRLIHTRLCAIILLLNCSLQPSAFAAGDSTREPGTDSMLPMRSFASSPAAWNAAEQERLLNSELSDIEHSYDISRDHRATYNRLRRLLRTRTFIGTRNARFRLYNDLAGISARLRLYTTAMQYYYATAQYPDSASQKDSTQTESTDQPNSFEFSNSSDHSGNLPPQNLQTSFTTIDSLADQPSASDQSILTAPSTPVKIQHILASFNDGKEACAYALLIEVKQPIPGKRKAFTHINNVGHTFITLIKYNRDNTAVCRSFGFYPHKTNPLSATPLQPTSPSVIKDDAGHEWDELAGKFISYRRFKKIIEALQSYEHTQYNLNHSNCTDFGLTMAGLGGITIGDARGRWPLGKGNNPGSAGQSMLEGKILNTDEGYTIPLFVCDNLAAHVNAPVIR